MKFDLEKLKREAGRTRRVREKRFGYVPASVVVTSTRDSRILDKPSKVSIEPTIETGSTTANFWR